VGEDQKGFKKNIKACMEHVSAIQLLINDALAKGRSIFIIVLIKEMHLDQYHTNY
jgi:hypothetical protein